MSKLNIVFQDFSVDGSTVYNNLEFVLKATGWKEQDGDKKNASEEVLQLVGMSNKGYKLPNELSGGEQQQRIVIACRCPTRRLSFWRIIWAARNLDVGNERLS